MSKPNPALESAHYTLDEAYPLSLITLTGDEISVGLQAIDIEPQRIEIHIAMDAQSWPQVIVNGAFHSDLDDTDEADKNDLGGDENGPIQAVLVLRQPLLHQFTQAQAFIDSLLSDEPTLLHQTEAWLLASALQAVAVPGDPGAKASIGLRTRWAAPFA